ncbi:MAG: hypothetical protein ACYSW8_26655 [Planctomycetota bacterium]
MDDTRQIEQLIEGGYSCISIVTHEEQYALQVLREVAIDLGREMLIWSVAGGIRNGILPDSAFSRRIPKHPQRGSTISPTRKPVRSALLSISPSISRED